ncbi:MAG: hypothetical protein Kapaf2KO_01640 [Candidatus Kapaibacteriales bacterium]
MGLFLRILITILLSLSYLLANSEDTYTDNIEDKTNLLKLYESMDNNAAKSSLAWDISKRLATWNNIEVDTVLIGEGSYEVVVTAIDISRRNHKGFFPPIELNNLKYLDISNNDFTGDLSSSSFPKLDTLQASRNSLSFLINELNLPKVRYLDISRNEVSGDIGEFDFSSILHLDVSENTIWGGIKEGQLRNIVYLDASGNELTYFNARIDSNIVHLNVAQNQIEGVIPDFISLKSLGYLNLSDNNISKVNDIVSDKLWYLGIGRNPIGKDMPRIILNAEKEESGYRGTLLNLSACGITELSKDI